MANVSIVIPHFNRIELLAETLQSIQSQSYFDWEVIIVDDGSDLEQLSRLDELASENIQIIQRQHVPKGPSTCRNLGVSHSDGSYIIFVDSDDLLAPWCLIERVKTMEARPEIGFGVFPVLQFHTIPGDQNLLWNDMSQSNDLERFLTSDPPWHTSSVLWRRESFEQSGGFNERVMYGDDSDLHARVLLKQVPYEKFCDHLPDAFVRRAECSRITNSPAETLLESRLIRLQEGSLSIIQHGPLYADIWEGQYFYELEFLLFNNGKCSHVQHRVVELWQEHHSPSIWKQWIVKSYLRIAKFTTKRAYLILRLTRRIAMLLLPTFYFPQNEKKAMRLSSRRYVDLRERLSVSQAQKGCK